MAEEADEPRRRSSRNRKSRVDLQLIFNTKEDEDESPDEEHDEVDEDDEEDYEEEMSAMRRKKRDDSASSKESGASSASSSPAANGSSSAAQAWAAGKAASKASTGQPVSKATPAALVAVAAAVARAREAANKVSEKAALRTAEKETKVKILDADGLPELTEHDAPKGEEQVKRKRGRPKGSKNKVKRITRQLPGAKKRSGASEETEEVRKARIEKMRALIPQGMMVAATSSTAPEGSGAQKRRSSPTLDQKPAAAEPAPVQRSVSPSAVAAFLAKQKEIQRQHEQQALIKSGEPKQKKRKKWTAAPLFKDANEEKAKDRETNKKQRSERESKSSDDEDRDSAAASAPPTIIATALRQSASSVRRPIASSSGTPVVCGSAPAIEPSADSKRQKRPKLRKGVKTLKVSDSPDLAPPAQTKTSWNASEVIKGFLYIGAGWDQNGRCLVNRAGDPPELKTQRTDWCRAHNMCYALNMAGSRLQRELKGIKYVLPETKFRRIDMNDLDSWDEAQMVAGFQQGAEFIEEAWRQHKEARTNCQLSSNTQIKIVPPTIFVHCVAGVNRSPMSVVWWLCRFHGVHIRDAWEIVRLRRDQGAFWKNVTLGGEAPPLGYEASAEEINEAATRKFQHRYDKPPPASAEAAGAVAEGAQSAPGKTATEGPVDGPDGASAASASTGAGTEDQSDSKGVVAEPADSATEEPAQVDPATAEPGKAGQGEPEPGKADPATAESGKADAAFGSSEPDPAKAANADAHAFSAAPDLPQQQVRYPKALWFVNSERLLSKYFRRRVDPLTGVSEPMPNVPPASEPLGFSPRHGASLGESQFGSEPSEGMESSAPLKRPPPSASAHLPGVAGAAKPVSSAEADGAAVKPAASSLLQIAAAAAAAAAPPPGRQPSPAQPAYLHLL